MLLSLFVLPGQSIEASQSEMPAEIVGLETDRLGQGFNGFGVLTKLLKRIGENSAIIGRVEGIELHSFAHGLNAALSITSEDHNARKHNLEKGSLGLP